MHDNFPSITDPGIKQELNISWKYIEWLHEKIEIETDTTLFLLLKKDIIIHLGSIIECLVFYAFDILYIKGLLNLEYIEEKIKPIHTISPSEYIAHIHQFTKVHKPKNIDFSGLIEILYENNIINVDLKEKLHEIRDLRNGVHLSKQILHTPKFVTIDLQGYYIPLISEVMRSLRKVITNY